MKKCICICWNYWLLLVLFLWSSTNFNEKKQFDQLKQERDGFVSIKSSFDLV